LGISGQVLRILETRRFSTLKPFFEKNAKQLKIAYNNEKR